MDPALFAVTISDLASGYVRRGDFDVGSSRLLESGETSTPSSLLAITYENLIAVLRQRGREKDAEDVERRLRAFIARQKGFPAS